MNNLLANAFFLYHCCVIYPENGCAFLVPCIIFFLVATIGILYVSLEAAQPDGIVGTSGPVSIASLTYYPLASSSWALVAFMIIARLATYRKNIRGALGVPTGATGSYGVFQTIMVESSALYAISFMLYIVPCYVSNSTQYVFLPIFTQTQVVAPLLVIKRIANGSALTRDTLAFKDVGSLQVASEEKVAGGGGAVSGWYPVVLVGVYGKTWALGLTLTSFPSMDLNTVSIRIYRCVRLFSPEPQRLDGQEKIQ